VHAGPIALELLGHRVALDTWIDGGNFDDCTAGFMASTDYARSLKHASPGFATDRRWISTSLAASIIPVRCEWTGGALVRRSVVCFEFAFQCEENVVDALQLLA